MIDLGSITLNTVTICLAFAEIDEGRYVPLSSIAILISYLRIFYFLRIFSATAALVSMMIQIVKDMVSFLLVLFMAVCAFSFSFYILA